MKIISPGYEILTPIDRAHILTAIETAARTCYKSEDKIGEGSAAKLVTRLVKLGHEAMLEHAGVTVKFICDRGVSHELVRHRIASYAQESQRYVNYTKEKFGQEITVIAPCFWGAGSPAYTAWETACHQAEQAYFTLVAQGAAPEEARTVLPNSTKTEIIVTMNMRAWRHFFQLRTAKAAHPQMRELTIPLLAEFAAQLPELFGDITTKNP